MSSHIGLYEAGVKPHKSAHRPSAALCASAPRASAETENGSACISWPCSVLELTGLNVPAPTCKVSEDVRTPAPLSDERSSGVKWRPAVGAATLPACGEVGVKVSTRGCVAWSDGKT